MGILSRETRVAKQYPRHHYRQHREKLVEKGTVKKEYEDSTKENIWKVMKKWTLHCAFLGEDRLDFLVRSTKEDIMTFLKWMLDVYPRIRKQSSVHEYWRVWRMLYRKSVGQSIHAKVMEEVNDYINGYLTWKYSLDTTTREKPVMNVDDVYLVEHHLWVLDTSVFPHERQRVQLAELNLIQAYTATRPGAVVYVPTDREKVRQHYIGWEEDEDSERDPDDMDLDEESIKTLCYEDVTLVMLPNPGGKRDLLVMEVTLRYTKGAKRKPKPKTFILTEVDDLIFDPILPMIIMALLDDAFDSDVKSIEDIYRTRVKPPRHSLDFKWKWKKLKTPIFRQAERGTAGIETSKSKALRYHTHLYYLQRLGLATGFMQILTSYCIRRGSGEAVEAVATQPQLQQVMDHRDAGVYQAYINPRVQCDVQAAFLGRPSRNALFKAVTHMSRYVDPRAPTELTSAQTEALKADPEIVDLRKARDLLASEVRKESGTIKKAEAKSTKLYQMYKKATEAFRCAKEKLSKAAKRNARQQFFDTIDTIEINKQLDPLFLDLKEEDWEPEKVEHHLEERRVLADLLCRSTFDMSDQEKLDHRIQTADAMLALSQKRDVPRRLKPDRTWGVQRTPDSDEASKHPPFPESCAKTQCIFCFYNPKESHDVRLHNYHTIYKARNHVELHLSVYKLNDPIRCPDPNCQIGTVLHGRLHFMNHAAREHNYDIFHRRDGYSRT